MVGEMSRDFLVARWSTLKLCAEVAVLALLISQILGHWASHWFLRSANGINLCSPIRPIERKNVGSIRCIEERCDACFISWLAAQTWWFNFADSLLYSFSPFVVLPPVTVISLFPLAVSIVKLAVLILGQFITNFLERFVEFFAVQTILVVLFSLPNITIHLHHGLVGRWCNVCTPFFKVAGNVGDEALEVRLGGIGQRLQGIKRVVPTLIITYDWDLLANVILLSCGKNLVNKGWYVLPRNLISSKVPVFSGRRALWVERRVHAWHVLTTWRSYPNIVTIIKELRWQKFWADWIWIVKVFPVHPDRRVVPGSREQQNWSFFTFEQFTIHIFFCLVRSKICRRSIIYSDKRKDIVTV